MKYISIGIIMLISFIISVVITKVEIPVLKRKAGQNIREDGPQSHLSKAGTPSMGGIAIIIAASLTTIGAAVMGKIDGLGCAIILLVFVGFGLIGFFDDYLKVIKKNNLGLRAYQKFGLQTILSVILAVYLANYTEGSTSVFRTGVFLYASLSRYERHGGCRTGRNLLSDDGRFLHRNVFSCQCLPAERTDDSAAGYRPDGLHYGTGVDLSVNSLCRPEKTS